MHRFITNNSWQIVDHINLNKLDNRKSNLREATYQLNIINKNCNKNNRLGVKGVTKLGEHRYSATIMKDRKHIYLGVFKTLEEARKARQEKEVELYGEFARTD